MAEKNVPKARLAMCAVAAALVTAAALVVVVMLMVTSSGRALASAGEPRAQCNAGHLVVCAAAIIGGAAPSESCCSNLRAEEGCFYQYARNPAYASYIDKPKAHRAIAACLVAVPSC